MKKYAGTEWRDPKRSSSEQEEARQKLAGVLQYLRGCSPKEAESSAKRWLSLLEAWVQPRWEAGPDPSPSPKGLRGGPRGLRGLLDARSYSGWVSETGSVYGLCPHHMMPYFGNYTLKFRPDKKLIGLSHIGRIVDSFSRRALLQEELTQALGEHFRDLLRPLALEFSIEARHFCKEMQGDAARPGSFSTLWAWPSAPEAQGEGKQNFL